MTYHAKNKYLILITVFLLTCIFGRGVNNFTHASSLGIYPLNTVSDVNTSVVVTISESTEISGNEVWNSDNKYIIKSGIKILQGSSLKIQPGTHVEIINNGYFEILDGGALNIGFANQERVDITISQIYNTVFSAYSGGEINISNTNIESDNTVLYQDIIGVYGTRSKINILESSIKNFNLNSEAIFSSGGNITMNNLTVENYSAPSFLVASNSSEINILNSVFSNLKTNNALNIFSKSILYFDKSSISSERFEAENPNSGACISGFNDTYIQVLNSQIFNCKIGFSFFGQGSFKIHKNNIYKNEISLQNYSLKVDAVDNWWGSASGLNKRIDNDGGLILNGYESGFASETECIPFSAVKFGENKCCSSVIFIPGMQGSRLYKKGLFGIENQLWEPNKNSDTKSLFMDKVGKPLFTNIYTRDIIAKTNFTGPILGLDIYRSLIDNLQTQKTAGAISDFYIFPYDWRNLPSAIITNGVKLDSNTIFLKSKIREMAKVSPTGQVIILSHSYGGLIAKSVASSLEKDGDLNKIESLIMVATPEFGTPQAISSVIYGDNQDLLYGLILSKETVVMLAKNMLSAYLLFPSIKYFSDYNNHKNIISLDKWSRDFFDINSPEIDSYKNFSLLLSKIKGVNYNLFNLAKFERGSIERARESSEISVNNEVYQGGVWGIDVISNEIAQKTYSVLGVGIPTLSRINFIKPRCRVVVFCNKTSLPDFDRTFSIMGDSVVLAGDTLSRTGSVFTVDIGLENEEKKTSWDFYISGGVAHKDIFRSDGITEVVNAIINRNYKSGLGLNSFSEIQNSKVSFVSDFSLKPSPLNFLYKTIDFLNIQKVNQSDVNFSMNSRLADSKIVITESYGPMVLKSKINEVENNLTSEFPPYKRIINQTEFSSGNSSGIASVVNCQNTNCQASNFLNGVIYGVGTGVGIGQIIVKNDNLESIYNNISVTGSTGVVIDYSTSTVSIDQNGDGVIDDVLIPVTSTSSDLKLSSIDLFKKARVEMGELLSLATASSSVNATSTMGIIDVASSTNIVSTTVNPGTVIFLINKYIEKINIAERKYESISPAESMKFINYFYNTIESNMKTASNLLESYKKEEVSFVAKKFNILNARFSFVKKRRLEIGDELIVYSKIHKIIFELEQGLIVNI